MHGVNSWKLSETMATWLWHGTEVLKAFVTETLTCLLLVKDQLRPNVKNLASHSRYRTAYVKNFTFRIRVDVPQKVSKNSRLVFGFETYEKCCHYCSREIMQYQECWVLVQHLAWCQRSGSTRWRTGNLGGKVLWFVSYTQNNRCTCRLLRCYLKAVNKKTTAMQFCKDRFDSILYTTPL